MFNNTLAEHALSASRILYLVCKSAPIQADLVTLFTEHKVCLYLHIIINLTLILLSLEISALENSVDPDQLASNEAI